MGNVQYSPLPRRQSILELYTNGMLLYEEACTHLQCTGMKIEDITRQLGPPRQLKRKQHRA